MKSYNLSAYTLNLFLECPRCFWLEINKGIKRPKGPFASIATGLDNVIKKYFDEYRNKRQLPPFLREQLKARLISFPLRNRLEFKDAENKVNLFGYLDECLILEDNFYAALDHKTRASFPTEVHPAYKFQMDVYTFLLEQNNYPTKRLAYLVYYIPIFSSTLHDGLLLDFKVVEIKTNPEEAKKILYQSLNILKGPLPKPGKVCEFCSWIEQINSETSSLL